MDETSPHCEIMRKLSSFCSAYNLEIYYGVAVSKELTNALPLFLFPHKSMEVLILMKTLLNT